MLGLAAAETAAAAPSVAVTGISHGDTVAPGQLSLGVDAGSTAAEVKWYLDGQEVAWDGAVPWQASIPSTKLTDGPHTLFAKAADASDAWATSTVVTFTVGIPEPVRSAVAVTAPAAAATLSGTTELTASASDQTGIRQMKWYVNGQEVAWDGSAPWEATWSTARVADGSHTITARAENGSGVWVNSLPVRVTVANTTESKPLPDVPTEPTDLAGWRLLMADDFDGPAVDTTKWRVYGPNWSGHAGNGLRDGRAVSIQDGKLTITAQMLDGVLVSGGLKARLSQAYGRYSFRARVDADPSGATTGCVLTWPTSENWPAEGENNIWETTTPSRYPFSTFIHYSPQNYQYWFHHYADGTQWHDMAMEWEPDEIRIYRDGVQVFKVNDAYAIPDWPHNLTLQLDAVKPWMSGVVRMEVDNVRVYAKA